MRPEHRQAVNFTGASLTPDKAEINGILTTLGGPGSSPRPVPGSVDVSAVGGHDYGTVSPGPAWDFELKPGASRVQVTANRVPCEPVVVKVVKGTVQVIDIACPPSRADAVDPVGGYSGFGCQMPNRLPIGSSRWAK
jgi:hypothetical protein